jgi:hypothetical protein
MKKLIYTSSVLFAFVFASCDMNDKNADRYNSQPESGWIQFADDDTREFVYGASSTIELPVELHTATNKGGIEISYSITDVSGSSTGIIPQRTGTSTLHKDEFGEVTLVGDLVVPVDVNAGLSGPVEFDVTITGTNKAGVQVGLSDDSKPTTIRVKMCPFNVATNYNGTAVSSEIPFTGPNYTVTLVPVEGEENTFTTTSAWGTQFVPTLAGNPTAIRDYPAIVKINPDFTVTVTGNDPAFPARYPGGTGTYNVCTGTFNINLQQGVFSAPVFTVDVVWTPSN